jgi:hypothetical protein
MALDPVTIGTSIVSAVFGLGAWYEYNTRKKALKDPGQNNITETDCDNLCRQLGERRSDLCHAQTDEEYTRVRWQQAALAAAGAAATALALHVSANIAAASIFGSIAAIALYAAALIASAAAVAAAGFATSAFTGWVSATTALNSARSAFSAARTQMTTACGTTRTAECERTFPPCP